jgi:hypothetical protein
MESWPVYSLYGISVASDFAFANRMAKATCSPELMFTLVPEPPCTDWQKSEPSYASPLLIESGKSYFYIYRQAHYEVLSFSEVADFYLYPGQILCQVLDPDYFFMVEIRLLGPVFAYWLERQGIPALHAAAAVVEGRAVAFLSTNKGGKTSLAATLMQQGYPLLTDDILPLERYAGSFRGRPGYPQMRMWPDQAQHFMGHCESLELVHPNLSKRRIPVGSDGLGSFCETAQPLGCLYLPERYEEGQGQITITPLSLKEAIMQLVRHTFEPEIVSAVGLEAKRFGFFAELVKQVPVYRLIYPTGVENLPVVRQAIIANLEAQLAV